MSTSILLIWVSDDKAVSDERMANFPGRSLIYGTSLANPAELTYMAVFGGHGQDDGQMIDPSGLCTDTGGNIISADSKNDRIQVGTSNASSSRFTICRLLNSYFRRMANTEQHWSWMPLSNAHRVYALIAQVHSCTCPATLLGAFVPLILTISVLAVKRTFHGYSSYILRIFFSVLDLSVHFEMFSQWTLVPLIVLCLINRSCSGHVCIRSICVDDPWTGISSNSNTKDRRVTELKSFDVDWSVVWRQITASNEHCINHRPNTKATEGENLSECFLNMSEIEPIETKATQEDTQ